MATKLLRLVKDRKRLEEGAGGILNREIMKPCIFCFKI